MSREPRKFPHARILAAYWRGHADGHEGRAPTPPAGTHERRAYVNGFNDGGKWPRKGRPRKPIR